jgi:hypothetical protein
MDIESAPGTFNTRHILAMGCHGNLRAENSDPSPPIMITVRFNAVPLTSPLYGLPPQTRPASRNTIIMPLLI